ncbi:isocitrate lyase/PEP mutase family protein [Eilatimonas milleporae]|uniref:2-methylisocitrate lyase-like PEP mutase family enzyme n=1 Tax=Eilatimonas milleporae TaxID=911205 RepID=A0A3M0C537_9PROT|nr:isocitrate lyase/PEP mutase family protein [Eilatimonas milleporae]RMB01936.1 2-methylisocitrate lyase-like PEP mutase family enzyme [Eilatimonas milleporae]
MKSSADFDAKRKLLRQKLSHREFFVAPGVYDMLAATVANDVGFDFVYGSGYWTIASAHGLPDAGIATYSHMVDRMRTIAGVSNGGLIADADTGYGGLLNVHHTVRGYEDAGVIAIQLEDQVFPKRCGHTRGKQVIGADEMAQKIQVAAQARQNPDTVIIARTDALAVEGFEAALKRAELYGRAGADVLFVEAVLNDAEMAAVCDRLELPVMINMADGGDTPIKDAKTLEDIGYAFAIFPAICSLHACAAIETALKSLKETGTSLKSGLTMYDFQKITGLIGFDEIYALDEKWKNMKKPV